MAETQTPRTLINMWLAARDLPEYGLDIDQFHLTHSGFPSFYYAGGQESYYGISLQNILTLTTLAEIRHAVDPDYYCMVF